MTSPYARPDQPDSDETIPLIPDSGYADQTSPWSSGYESTAVDPLGAEAATPGGYTNPVVSGGYANPAPSPSLPPAAPASSHLPPAAPPAAYPSAAPSGYPLPPAQAPYPTAPLYEQPPAAYGVAPFEPARDGSPAPMVPAYSYVYGPQQIEHPNSVPALVLGVLGFFFGVTFPIAWYLGAKGNADVKRNPQRYRSSPMLTIGMVLGIVGTALMTLFALMMVAFILFAVVASR